MRRFFIVITLSVATLSGCVKSDDFDALGHGLEITGQLHPSLGLPIGHASMDVAGLIGTWQELNALVICDPSTRFLSFVYSSSFDGTVDFGSKKGGHFSKSLLDTVLTYTEHLSGTVDIDMFMHIDSIDLIGTYVSLQSFIQAFGHNDYEFLMNKYKVNPYFSNIKITVVGQTGNTVLLPAENTDSVTVLELIEGKTLTLADHEDMSNCLRTNPVSIQYDIDLNVDYSVSALEAAAITNPISFIKDSIMLDSLTTHTTIDANFPLQVKSSAFTYSMTMDLPFETVEDALADFRERISFGDSSYMALRFVNTLPFSFEMIDTLLDANNRPIRYADNSLAHLYQRDKVIASASLKDTMVEGAHYNISDGEPKETILKCNISDRNLDALLRARKMRMTMRITSASLPGSTMQHVTIRQEDGLESSLYIVTNPQSMQ
ncbi:MAG: hypothetical protein AUK63_708 [bacterium P3]|nr:MAG: hypothetical protein AUK63_708 [bacterium P3]KWW42191.1 MAG: hypothetical protein F083_530 [bacterium F083]